MAPNQQTLTPIDILMQDLGLVDSLALKYAIFVKSLNFQSHGTPQTADAARNANRKLECEKNDYDSETKRSRRQKNYFGIF